VNQIIVALTSESLHDSGDIRLFLLVHQTYVPSEILFQKLVERYNVPRDIGETEERWIKRSFPIRLRVINLLRQWILELFSDFSPSIALSLQQFISGVSQHSPQLALSLTKAIKEQQIPASTETTKKSRIPRRFPASLHNFMDISNEEIAQQLTIIDFNFFRAIEHREFLNKGWSRQDKSNSKNITAWIKRFNELHDWTACSILSEKVLSSRARLLAKFISIAHELLKLRNFSSLFAIHAGLISSSVYRLKHTWQALSKQEQEAFTALSSTVGREQSMFLFFTFYFSFLTIN
jgi:hypothetical protein